MIPSEVHIILHNIYIRQCNMYDMTAATATATAATAATIVASFEQMKYLDH